MGRERRGSRREERGGMGGGREGEESLNRAADWLRPALSLFDVLFYIGAICRPIRIIKRKIGCLANQK